MRDIMIIEDQVEFSDKIKAHLERKISEKKVFEAIKVYNTNFVALLESLKEKGRNKHLYIIDIDLKDAISGLEFAVGIRRIDPDSDLIFLTSHIELMSQVFVHSLKAIGFIHKGDPLWRERMDATIDQIYYEQDLEPKKAETLETIQNNDSIQYQYKNTYYKIFIDQITFIETDSIKRRLDIYTEKEIYHCPWKLKELVDQLPESFIQIYRSIIVNAKAIHRITQNMGNYSVVLNNDMVLPISKNYIENVIRVFHETSF